MAAAGQERRAGHRAALNGRSKALAAQHPHCSIEAALRYLQLRCSGYAPGRIRIRFQANAIGAADENRNIRVVQDANRRFHLHVTVKRDHFPSREMLFDLACDSSGKTLEPDRASDDAKPERNPLESLKQSDHLFPELRVIVSFRARQRRSRCAQVARMKGSHHEGNRRKSRIGTHSFDFRTGAVPVNSAGPAGQF